ncbi:MAG TPA: hypothetical protein VFG05_05795 [Methylocella sp.]|nr:hypothetical protein [Methylocella sp.]
MNNALPMAETAHVIPGRTRLRIAAQRGNAAFFESAAAILRAIPGVSKAEGRPLTGSLVIHHDAPLSLIVAAALEKRLFAVAEKNPAPAPEWPELPLDLRSAARIALGLLAFWQFIEGRVLPPALTLAWYAARLAPLPAETDEGDAGNGSD